MGDWVELAQSAFIALIFAFMIAKLISIVVSFRGDNLRITRDVAPDYFPESVDEAQSWTELQNVEGKRVPGNYAEENEGNESETLEKYVKTLSGEGLEAETLEKDGEIVRNEGSEVLTFGKGDRALRGKGLEVQTVGGDVEALRSEGMNNQTLGKVDKTLASEGLEVQTLGKYDKNLRAKDLEVESLGTGGKAQSSEGLGDEFGSERLHGESHLGEEEDDDWEGVESTELDEAFGAAASYIATMAGQSTERIPNDVQLQFYGLYKLATEGPCTVPQPSALKITARAKWHAWQRLGTMSPEAAMQKYIALLTDVRPSWADGMKQKSRKNDEESSHQSTTKGAIGPVFSSFANYEGSDDETKLEITHSYASKGETTGLLQVLDQGYAVDMKDSQGRTALHWAADRGHLKTLEILISKGADVNAKDMEGQTPLHYAFVCEQEDIARYLIDNGADASVKDNDGEAPNSICPPKWTWMSGNM
ncbi:hypothetical protein KI387_004621 [Taxus chinensis]|uniref:ACB domain-containing protein n=1 Tax=Taxus chinensis TaxID=29808 RepID=A0AA38GLS9_TAXCH|nr:hypothetical protein KI387_004621 [Taxus chinensis]